MYVWKKKISGFLRKQSTFRNTNVHWFARGLTSEDRAQKFHTDDVSPPTADLGSASDWLKNPDLGSDTSLVWIFCSHCSDVFAGGTWRREVRLFSQTSGFIKILWLYGWLTFHSLNQKKYYNNNNNNKKEYLMIYLSWMRRHWSRRFLQLGTGSHSYCYKISLLGRLYLR